MDEGPGIRELIDASDKKINALLTAPPEPSESDKIWTDELPNGDPLEHEDRWGVKSVPNRALKTDPLNNFVKIKENEGLQKMKNSFTLEFWAKFTNINEGNVLLENSKGNFKIMLTKEFCLFLFDSIKSDIKIPLDPNIAEIMPSKWTHIAIIYHVKLLKTIQIIINGKLCGFSSEKIPNSIQNWVNDDIFLSKFKGEITEIRIWNTNLNVKILSDNKKIPLSILANRQNMLQLAIKKQSTVSGSTKPEAKKPGLIAPPKKAGLAPPPKSGSTTGIKKISMPPKNAAPIKNEIIKQKIENEEQKSEIIHSNINEIPKQIDPFEELEKIQTIAKEEKKQIVEKTVKTDSNMAYLIEESRKSIESVSSNSEDSSNFWTNSGRHSTEKPLPTASAFKKSQPKPKSDTLKNIVINLKSGNLGNSMQIIEETLKKYSQELLLTSQDKLIISQLSRYKLLVKILTVIHSLRQNEDLPSLQKCADLANVAVVIKTSRKVKTNLYKLAVFLAYSILKI